MQDCTYKWPIKDAKKMIFFLGKGSLYSPQTISKTLFTLDKYWLKKWVENSVSAINRTVLGAFSPWIKLILLHKVFVLQYTQNMQTTCLIKDGRLSKSSKTNYSKSSLDNYFVQTCGLILFYNSMHTVFCFDTPQWTGQAGWTINRTGKLCVLDIR